MAHFISFIGQHSLKLAEKENNQWEAQSTHDSVGLGNCELITRHQPPEPSISPGLALASYSQTTCTNSAPASGRLTPNSQPNIERAKTSRPHVRHKPYSDVRHKVNGDPNASSKGKKTIRIVVHDDDVDDESNMDTEMNGIQADKTQHVVNSNNSDSFSMVPSETVIGETGTCIANSEVNSESHFRNNSICTNKAQNIDISGLDMSVTDENTNGSGNLDSMNIKVETNTVYDSDLEISGVEPANSEYGKLVYTGKTETYKAF